VSITITLSKNVASEQLLDKRLRVPCLSAMRMPLSRGSSAFQLEMGKENDLSYHSTKKPIIIITSIMTIKQINLCEALLIDRLLLPVISYQALPQQG